MTDKESEQRIIYNMDYLNLSRRQAEIHDIIMQSIMDTWPKSLKAYVKQQSNRYGFCGEIIVSCVADWIAERVDPGGGK